MAGALWDTVWGYDPAYGTVGDWKVADPVEETLNVGGLTDQDELATAIILALYSDAELPEHMIGRFGFTEADRQQWHGNTFGVEGDEEELGSLLYVLRRAPLTYETLRLAEHWAAEALQTLVRQRKVLGFDIHAEMDKPNSRIVLHIRTLGPQERMFAADLFALR